MNWLDFTLLGLIAVGTFFGILTGPLWQIYRISSVALSVTAAFLFHKLLSNILNGILGPKISEISGYAIAFGVVLIITYAIGNLFRTFLTKRKFGIRGRIIGGGLSFTKTVFTCCIIITGASLLGNDQTVKAIGSSMIADKLDKGTKAVIPGVFRDVKDMPIAGKKDND